MAAQDSALAALQERMGARLAPDGIPLHFGDMPSEYQAALQGAILLDRSHEGRILLQGESRFELINRMSTNNLIGLRPHEGKPTIFTNANARILFRAICYNLPEGLLLISEPGQGPALRQLLQRNIFFGDQVTVRDLSPASAQFALHGPKADLLAQRLGAQPPPPGQYHAYDIRFEGSAVTLARRKSIAGPHWAIICPSSPSGRAAALFQALLEPDRTLKPQAAGSLVYNVLRIRSGKPAGLELSSAYIPLEVGLWDEVSFEKGCYTGQEILARMESRQRLAKVMVKLELSQWVAAPAKIYADGRECGQLSSSVKSPAGEIFALAIIKTANARPGQLVEVGADRSSARVSAFAGAQPAFISRAFEQNADI